MVRGFRVADLPARKIEMASAEKLVAPSIRIADRLNRISVSPTMAVLAAAEKLKAEGIDVADFGPGEPDFPTPEHIKKAAIKALDENRTKYTAAAGIMPSAPGDLRLAQARIALVVCAERVRGERGRQARDFSDDLRAH